MQIIAVAVPEIYIAGIAPLFSIIHCFDLFSMKTRKISSYRMKQASPKLKKRYLSFTASS